VAQNRRTYCHHIDVLRRKQRFTAIATAVAMVESARVCIFARKIPRWGGWTLAKFPQKFPQLTMDTTKTMGNAGSSGNVVSLDATRKRRDYIALAYASESLLQIRASVALSGTELTDEDAERAGRLLAGAFSFEVGLAEIRREAGLLKG